MMRIPLFRVRSDCFALSWMYECYVECMLYVQREDGFSKRSLCLCFLFCLLARIRVHFLRERTDGTPFQARADDSLLSDMIWFLLPLLLQNCTNPYVRSAVLRICTRNIMYGPLLGGFFNRPPTDKAEDATRQTQLVLIQLVVATSKYGYRCQLLQRENSTHCHVVQ